MKIPYYQSYCDTDKCEHPPVYFAREPGEESESFCILCFRSSIIVNGDGYLDGYDIYLGSFFLGFDTIMDPLRT